MVKFSDTDSGSEVSMEFVRTAAQVSIPQVRQQAAAIPLYHEPLGHLSSEEEDNGSKGKGRSKEGPLIPAYTPAVQIDLDK